MFPICRLLSFSFLSRASLRAAVVPWKEKGESEGEEKHTNPFTNSKMSDWRSSTMRVSMLKAFIAKGFLPLKEVAH